MGGFGGWTATSRSDECGGIKAFFRGGAPRRHTHESRWAPGSRPGLTPNGTPKPLGNASTLCICATRCSWSRAFATAAAPATHHAPPASSPLHTVMSDTVLRLSLSSVGRLSIRTRPPGRSRLASRWLQHLKGAEATPQARPGGASIWKARTCAVRPRPPPEQAQAPASCAGAVHHASVVQFERGCRVRARAPRKQLTGRTGKQSSAWPSRRWTVLGAEGK